MLPRLLRKRTTPNAPPPRRNPLPPPRPPLARPHHRNRPLMKSLTDLAQQFADGLITATEFRDHLAIRLIAIQDETDLFLLCTLLLRTEEKAQ